ncbi:hypothetical protein DXG01_012478 [Tephrocybe rancida]|nr:hypothetical protein DXG01_012478 [Tephrocybe rancida]
MKRTDFSKWVDEDEQHDAFVKDDDFRGVSTDFFSPAIAHSDLMARAAGRESHLDFVVPLFDPRAIRGDVSTDFSLPVLAHFDLVAQDEDNESDFEDIIDAWGLMEPNL